MTAFRPARRRARLVFPPLAAAALAVAAALPAAAETDAPPVAELPETVVTATRLPTPLEQVASTVTVITADEIARNQYRTLPEALRRVPGLNVVQSGPTGAVTSVFMRGTESNHTLVLIDGIEINDPSTPDGAFDFANILLSDVARIEVLRGSQSTLYGSDAIGGVINIITKRGQGPARASAAIEGGTQATFNQTAGIGGAVGRFDYRFSVEHFNTDGESITPKRNRPAGVSAEDDGFESIKASTRLGLQLTDNARVNLVAHYQFAQTDLDPSAEDPNALQNVHQFFGRASAEVGLFDGRFDNRFGVAYTDFNRNNSNPADAISSAFSSSTFRGKKLKFDWQGDIALAESHVLTLGLETEKEKSNSASAFSSGFSSETNNEARTNAAFAQIQSAFGDRLFATLGVRVDDHDRFNRKTTWRIAPTYIHRETGTKIKGSYGTGFKAPTLEQLFGRNFFGGFGTFQGNPDLKPETSRAWDVGFEQPLFGDRLRFGATYFDIRIDDLIAFNDSFSSLINIDKAKTRGVEAFVSARPAPALLVRVDYTFTLAQDATTGFELLRRPHHKASLDIAYDVTENTQISASVLYTGRRTDIDSNTFQRIKTGGYTVVNLAGSYRLTDSVSLTARIDNLFDKSYEPADGFQAAGISALVGLKATF